MRGGLCLVAAGIAQPVVGAFDVQPQRDIDAISHPVIEQLLDLRGGRTALRAREHVGVHLEGGKSHWASSSILSRQQTAQGAGWMQHLLHASSMSILHGLGAVGVRAPDALVATNNGVAQVRAFQAGEGIG